MEKLAIAFGPFLAPFLADLWSCLFAGGLSQPLLSTLGALSKHVPSELPLIQRHVLDGPGPLDWRWRGRTKSMYDREHDALFAAIRAGEPINNGDYMCKATMMAIMGRMSAYTGKVVTWDMAWSSQLDLSPASYEWGPAPKCEVAVPGQTEFV